MELVNYPTSFLDIISQPWHWAVSGASLALILWLMTWLGRKFGISTSFETWCSVAGAGKRFSFFQRDLKDDMWRIVFVAGAILGGFLSANYLQSPNPIDISDETIAHLATWNIDYNASVMENPGFLPFEIFNLTNSFGILLAVIGGFLVGFGARYAKGCTSGHAITGLAHLQLPSLVTVIGFFIGGLIMTHLFMPFIFG